MTGEELRRRRRALGLNQTELGELLGLTQNTISRWEKGAAVIGHPKLLAWALTGIEHEVAWVDLRESLTQASTPPGRGYAQITLEAV